MKPCCNRDVMTRLILPGCASRNMSSPHDSRLNGTSPPIGNALLYLLMASTADPITIILLLGGNYAISQLFQLATAGVVFLQLKISPSHLDRAQHLFTVVSKAFSIFLKQLRSPPATHLITCPISRASRPPGCEASLESCS